MRDLSVLYDTERLERMPRLFVFAYVVSMIGLFALTPSMIDNAGKPLGYDFITFWSAGVLTLGGNAAGAFDFKTIASIQQMAVPGLEKLFLWHYPPTFQLATMPLAMMPYFVSYFVFVAGSLVLFVAALRPLVPHRDGWIILLALPATFICVMHGQNSLISAALIGTAIMTIDRRPIVAGICIGLLAYKPQLGILFPLILAITGRWRVMAVAAATMALFVGVSVLAFGVDLWGVFFRNLSVAREVTEAGLLPWGKMPSAFVFLRMLGVPQGAAYAAQIMVAMTAAAVVGWVWWRCGATLLAGAVLVTGTMLLTPYTFDYEMAIMAVPLAVIARHLVRHGASDGAKIMLLLLAASPLAMGTPVDKIGIQVGFIALAILFCWSAHLALVARGVRIVNIPASHPATSFSASG
jgi:alpha-1,2-mannosyltransferase